MAVKIDSLKITFGIYFFMVIVTASFFKPQLINESNQIENLLTTITQVEGTIIAIFISLLLVAIQLTIREYSDVVLEVYSHYWLFWLMFLSYILSIIYNVSLLGNKNLEWGLVTFGYYWGVVNLSVFPEILRRILQLFKTEQFIDKFFEVINLSYRIENSSPLNRLFRVGFRCIQTRNMDALFKILEKLDKFYKNNPEYRGAIARLKKLTNNENREKMDKDLENDLTDVLMFIEFLALNLRGLGLKVIGEFDIGSITKYDMISVIRWIMRLFDKILNDLVREFHHLHSADSIGNKIKRTFEQCLEELNDIKDKMEKFEDPEIKRIIMQLDNMVRNYQASNSSFDSQ